MPLNPIYSYIDGACSVCMGLIRLAGPAAVMDLSAGFEFSDAPFDVDPLQYNYFGDATNSSVNRHEPSKVDSPLQLPLDVAPGVTATLFDEQIARDGPITSLPIGSRESAIDNITAIGGHNGLHR